MMVHLLRLFISLMGLCCVQTVVAYGLRFQGMDYPIARRTSFSVFARHQPTFKDYFDIAFDMAFYPTESNIGYVVRVKGEDEEQIFNLFFDFRGDDVLFRLNQEGSTVLIALPVNRMAMTKEHWFKVKIAFHLQEDKVTLAVHDQQKTCEGVELPDTFKPEIVFGRSGHIIDVPAVAINHLQVHSGSRDYLFALDEVEGEAVHDQEGNRCGVVENPVWMINEAFHWRKEAGFASSSEAGSCCDMERGELYYINRDSLYIYQMETGVSSAMALAGRCPVKLFLASCFVDGPKRKLYVYEVFHGPDDGDVSIASLDLNTLQWQVESRELLERQLHHHNAYFDEDRKRYTIFGGFGNMHYSDQFYMLDTGKGHWEKLGPLSGDPISPRYFSAVAYRPQRHLLYIFGGMGNESGDQVVGRKYFHDLYQVDLQTLEARRLWDRSASEPKVVPARDMVMRDDSCFYVLRYPESVSASHLHLYRFSVADGSYQLLGDSLPIWSDKITTCAHLYYNERTSRLFATVQESRDDVSSTFTVYSLLFPPVTPQAYESASRPSLFPHWLKGSVVLLLVALAGGIIFRQRKKGKGKAVASAGSVVPSVTETASTSVPVHPAVPESSGSPEPPSVPGLESPSSERPLPPEEESDAFVSDRGNANSIYVFGDFAIYDRQGRNVSYLFSSRLRQVFCTILRYSNKEGVSSQQLGAWIWPDKPKEKVKSSRNVAINGLRKILSGLDGIELVYAQGCFRFQLSEGFYCDYLRCMEMISSGRLEGCLSEFAEIVRRGRFIQFQEDPFFDHFKQEVEDCLESFILKGMQTAFRQKDYPLVVSLAEAEFHIDSINGQALDFLVMAQLALKHEKAAMAAYDLFLVEYRRCLGEEYPYTWAQMLDHARSAIDGRS